MAENVMDQVVAGLRLSGAAMFPQLGELRNVRVVGHTPKSDHYIYDVVMDFAEGSERLAAKVYHRTAKNAARSGRAQATQEAANLERSHRLVEKHSLTGIPRPIGDFTEFGAVVSEKLCGIPLQSIIMKAALLPGYADHGTLEIAARLTGEWLRKFHKATKDKPTVLETGQIMTDLEKLCRSCRGEGMDQASINKILSGADSILSQAREPLMNSAVLNEFNPLNVIVGERGVGFGEFAQLSERGPSFNDVAQFLASVEALEKYPFCNRMITSEVQDNFLLAYGVSEAEEQLLRVLKIQALLSMFAKGRNVKESALRKKVMWATVMKRFIQQAADRSLAPAA